MKKLFTLSLMVAACASLNAETISFLTFGMGIPGIDEPQLIGLGISPDGRYVCGTLESGQGYFVFDTQTNDVAFGISEDPEGAELRNVDNNGVGIGYDGPGILFSIKDEDTVLDNHDPSYKYVLGEALTNDGTTLVGSLIGAGYQTVGAVSRNGGEWTPLPNPTDFNASAAKQICGDGSVILGYVGNWGPAIIWTLDENGDYIPDPIYQRYVVLTEDELDNPDKPFLNLIPCNISNNGKYLALKALLKSNNRPVPVVLNLETDEMTIYEEQQEIDSYYWGLTPTAIADDGTFIGLIGTSMMENSGNFIMRPGQTQAQKITEAFPEIGDKLEDAENHGYNILTDLSKDGRYILGYQFYADDYYDENSNAYYTTYIIDTLGDSYVDEINSDKGAAIPEAIFSIDGKRVNSLQKGINIMRMSDGSVKKVMK